MIISEARGIRSRVDEADYSFLVRWRWTFKKSSGKWGGSLYACRNVWVGSRADGDRRQVKVMMHDVVAERAHGPRPAGHVCHHKNSDPLDNRRANLEWVTISQNVKEAWKTRKKNASPPARHGDDRPDREPHDQADSSAPPY